MKSFTFNDVRKDWIVLRPGRKKVPFPGINRTTVEVPGMDGAHLTSQRLEPIVIEQPFRYVAETDEEALQLKDELADWLYTTKPAPLTFDDEPGRTYFAVVQGTIDDFDKNTRVVREGTISFLCVDPFSYGDETSIDIIPETATEIVNVGTSETYPIFDLTVTEKSTLISMRNLSNLNSAGEPREIKLGVAEKVGTEPVDKKRLILHDTMQSTASWQNATSVDSGFVTGTMATDINGFYASDYGEEDTTYSGGVEEIDKDIDARKKTILTKTNTNTNEINRLKARIATAKETIAKYQKDLTAKKNALAVRKSEDLKKLKAGKIKVLPSYTTDENRIKDLQTKIVNLNKDIDTYNSQIKALQAENTKLFAQIDALTKERADRVKALQSTTMRGWIGPSLQKPLPELLNSFIADIMIKNWNYKDATGALVPTTNGIIEIYFRDVNGNMICKIAFGDSNSAASENIGTFASASQRKTGQPKSASAWHNFQGVLRVIRDSDYYYPYIASVDSNGKHTNIVDFGTIIPGPGVGTNEVASIQVAVRKYIGSKRMAQRISEIKVWSIIGEFEYPDYTPVYEFNAGDHVYIDANKGLFLLNGEQRADLVHLSSDFFSLVEGINDIEFSDNIQGAVIYRDRYL